MKQRVALAAILARSALRKIAYSGLSVFAAERRAFPAFFAFGLESGMTYLHRMQSDVLAT
jgi:hypothetical protein